ncbi:hypothetical protein ACJ73_09084 [Blastomyces percursus]|uniref:Uncharacterized protein n=1 Tax=Blastomyces percursus TaxID=1658174 RepID=A0A1J9PD19_9EURO|nr:hypothetical protein ACJ73_09084 [Blastomyces percursus]
MTNLKTISTRIHWRPRPSHVANRSGKESVTTVVDKDSTLAGHIKKLEIGDLRKEDIREMDELVKTAEASHACYLTRAALATFNYATLPTFTTLKVLAESLVSRQPPLINHLPPALECLYVKEANDEVNEDTLPKLLIDYITTAPARLKLVSILSYAQYWKDRAASLDNACKHRGVKLKLQYRIGMHEVRTAGYMAILKTHGIEDRWQRMPLNH